MSLDENLVDRLNDATKALRQAFYFSLVFSLLSIYLLVDYRNPLPTEAIKVKEDVHLRLAEIEPIYALNDALRSNGALVRGYFRFLEPFVAIDTSAEQAVMGVSVEDPRWLSLDPTDRDLARSTRDMVQWLEHQVERHMNSDLRDLPIFNIAEYYSWYIYPELEFSNEHATRRLKASFRVAQALGQHLSQPSEWPSNYGLYDFVLGTADEAEISAFEAARDKSLQEIKSSSVFLESFCRDNDVDNCSFYEILAELDRGAFKIGRADKSEKIEISFFPGGLETQVFLLVSPFLLFGSVFIGASQYYRRLAILVEVSKDPDWKVERDTPWLMTNRHTFSVLPNALSITCSLVAATLIITGLLMPVVAQSLSFSLALDHAQAGATNWGWTFAHLAALASTGIVTLLMINNEFSALKVLHKLSRIARDRLAMSGRKASKSETDDATRQDG